jgi:hypothetical protein
MHGRYTNTAHAYIILLRKTDGKIPFVRYVCVDERIILKWILGWDPDRIRLPQDGVL